MTTTSDQADTGAVIPDPAAGKTEEANLGLPGMVLAAIGGSIGILSFVAFFGGAILWVRMDEAGLPGSQAVALIPRSVLLATGAKFLVPSLLVALGFTAALYVIETLTIAWRTRSVQKLETELEAKEEIAEARHEEALAACRKAEERAERAVAAQKAMEALAETPEFDSEILKKTREETEAIGSNAQQLLAETIPDAQRAEGELIETRREVERKRREACEGIDRKRRHLRRILILALFAIGAVLTFVVFSISFGWDRLGVLSVLVVALGTFCLAVLEQHRFAWFALATFVSVGILSGFLTYYRTVDRPKVEPAAVLRTDGPPIYGFFVAQTSDRVYVGTTMAGGALRLTAIPREEVTDLVVADLEPLNAAIATGRTLAIQSCRLSRQRSSAKSTPVRTTLTPDGETEGQVAEACTHADLGRLIGDADSSPSG